MLFLSCIFVSSNIICANCFIAPYILLLHFFVCFVCFFICEGNYYFLTLLSFPYSFG